MMDKDKRYSSWVIFVHQPDVYHHTFSTMSTGDFHKTQTKIFQFSSVFIFKDMQKESTKLH